jgi:hypothetical protein
MPSNEFSTIASARFKRATPVTSVSGIRPAKIGEPRWARTPAESKQSLTVQGTPWRDPTVTPAASSSSAALAASNAPSARAQSDVRPRTGRLGHGHHGDGFDRSVLVTGEVPRTTGCGYAGVVNICRYARRLAGDRSLHAAICGFHLNEPGGIE